MSIRLGFNLPTWLGVGLALHTALYAGSTFRMTTAYPAGGGRDRLTTDIQTGVSCAIPLV